MDCLSSFLSHSPYSHTTATQLGVLPSLQIYKEGCPASNKRKSLAFLCPPLHSPKVTLSFLFSLFFSSPLFSPNFLPSTRYSFHSHTLIYPRLHIILIIIPQSQENKINIITASRAPIIMKYTLVMTLGLATAVNGQSYAYSET